MWEIKDVKAVARQKLKRNYWIFIAIIAVCLLFEVIPGNGLDILSISTTSITGEAVENSTQYQSGLTRYLSSILNGESRDKQLAIAQDVMNSFNGLGGNVYGIVRAVDQFFFANEAAAKVLIAVSFVVYLAFAYMVRNPLYIGLCRITMESENPKHKVHFADFFTVFNSVGYLNTAKVMLVWMVSLDLLFLCSIGLTIGGATVWVNQGFGFLPVVLILLGVAVSVYYVRRYMILAMVPYIMATNPSAPLKKCFALSRALMDGSKWKLFLLRLSYIGWDLLSIPTLGLLNLFYIAPATYMAYGSLYLKLREKARNEKVENVALLGDNSFELLPLQPSKFGKMIENKNPERHYALVNIILLFFIFAFIGWCWEVLIHIIKDGVFVNRGTMHGPWLPIYGFGGAGIVFFLRRFAKKPWILFPCIFVGCGILEYVTHWYLEITKGTKWWDYSNYFLNINGRICFEGLFVFCVAGAFAIYIAGPALDDLLNRVSVKKRWTAAGILLAIFTADGIYSHFYPNKGKGITDYGNSKG